LESALRVSSSLARGRSVAGGGYACHHDAHKLLS
jgi:hypothetical protein